MPKIQLDDNNFVDLTIEKDLLQDLRISIESFDLSWRNKPELIKVFFNKLYLQLAEFQEEDLVQVYLDSSFLMLVSLRIKTVPLGFLMEYCRNYSALQQTCFKYTLDENEIEIAIEQQELYIKINNSYYKDVKKDIKSQIRLLKSICNETKEILRDSCLEYILIEPIHDKHADRIDDFALAGNYDRRFLVFVDDFCDALPL